MAEAEQLNAKPNIPKGLIKALSIKQSYAKPLDLMPCPGKVGFLRLIWMRYLMRHRQRRQGCFNSVFKGYQRPSTLNITVR
jgi:hypothetical protein